MLIGVNAPQIIFLATETFWGPIMDQGCGRTWEFGANGSGLKREQEAGEKMEWQDMVVMLVST